MRVGMVFGMALALGACAGKGGEPVETVSQAMSASASAQAAQARRLAALAEAYFEDGLRLDPFYAPYYGDYRYNDRFGDNLSDAYLKAVRELDERSLAELGAIDRTQLAAPDQMTYDVLAWELRGNIEARKFPDHLLPFNQFYSRISDFSQMGSGEGVHPFETPKDYADFLKKAEGFAAWTDLAAARLREGMDQNVVLPRILVERILPQLAAQLGGDVEKSQFWGPIRRMPEQFNAAERTWLREAYARTIRERILPSYRKLHDFLKTEYLPKARASHGYGALPGGGAWYAHYVRQHTTTELTPEQIHQIGQDEVARIRGEMEAVRAEVGFEGDLKAFFQHLATDEQFYFSSGEALVAGYRELKQRINALLPAYFDLMPRADYEVKPVEAFREQSAAGASYEPGSPDGERVGVFYINTYNLRAQPKFGMETLSLHEAAPGHHFQISIQQEMSDLPKFRRFGGFTAFDEGWALYAESIGKEMGLFTDPYQYYGRLSDEMLRAMRLVVDTGLHHKGWSREQAIAYMLDNSSMAESDVTAEVERYMAIPGQALSYKIGQLKITELRRYAEAELGAKFDVKAFHNQVLASGALPMAVLEGKIKAWVAVMKSR
ncbi:MAG: DUF885 domain-containing protein [Gammaproteobacteria bacterium]|nr:DUF885 domain-containing protein [Gammaproteobacteria bacterium]